MREKRNDVSWQSRPRLDVCREIIPSGIKFGLAWPNRWNWKELLLVLLPIREPWQAVLAMPPNGNREHGWANLANPLLPKEGYTLGQTTFDLMVSKHWWD